MTDLVYCGLFWLYCTNSLLSLEVFHRVLTVPDFLTDCANVLFTLDLRSDQQTRKSGATLGDKAAFATMSALSLQIMPTCEGIHAMIIWICGGYF